jgi:hypothetical protein
MATKDGGFIAANKKKIAEMSGKNKSNGRVQLPPITDVIADESELSPTSEKYHRYVWEMTEKVPFEGENANLAVPAQPAQRYDTLPSHLNFMWTATSTKNTNELAVKELVVNTRNAKADLQLAAELTAKTKKVYADNELIKYKTIKNPVTEKKKRSNWKEIQLSAKDKPAPPNPKTQPVRSQSSPALIRETRTQDFMTIREHRNELVDIARKNLFHTTIDEENEPVLPWKSVFRKPKRVKKPLSPFKMDNTGKGNQEKALAKYYSERVSKKESDKLQQPRPGIEPLSHRDIMVHNYNPKGSLDQYRLVNPSSSSSQLVHSNSFFELPDDHIANQDLHESPPPSSRQRQVIVQEREHRHETVKEEIYGRKSMLRDVAKEAKEVKHVEPIDDTDNKSDITDSLSVRENIIHAVEQNHNKFNNMPKRKHSAHTAASTATKRSPSPMLSFSPPSKHMVFAVGSHNTAPAGHYEPHQHSLDDSS